MQNEHNPVMLAMFYGTAYAAAICLVAFFITGNKNYLLCVAIGTLLGLIYGLFKKVRGD